MSSTMIQKSQFKWIVLGFCNSGHIYYKLLLIMYVCMLYDKGRLRTYTLLYYDVVWEDQRQNSTVSAIKCQVYCMENTAVWSTNIVQFC